MRSTTLLEALTSLYLLTATTQAASCNNNLIWLPLGPCTITQPNGPTIHSWGGRVGVGDHNQQLCVTPSTVVNSTLLMAPSVCEDSQLAAENMTHAQCASRRGGFIDPGALTAASASDRDSLASSNHGWLAIAGPGAFDTAVNSVIHLHGGRENDVIMLEGIIASGRNHTASHLGLGDHSSLLETLVKNKRIQDRSFGLDTGSTSVSAPRDGSIVFGDYDAAAIDGAFVEYPMSYSRILNDRVCPLQVTIKQLSLRQPGESDHVLFGAEWPLQACIEPYDNLFRLPGTLVKNNLIPALKTVLGSDPVSLPAVKALWVNEPGLTFPNNKSDAFEGSLVVTLDQNFTVEIPGYELVRPLRGLAPNGTSAVENSFAEVQVYHDSNEPLNAAVLGKVFLSQVYIFVDYDTKVFKLANMNVDKGNSAPVAGGSGVAACLDDLGKISGVTIGVIVIGVVLGLLLLGLAVWLWKRKQAQRQKKLAMAHDDDVTTREDKRQDYPEVDHLGLGSLEGRTVSSASPSQPSGRETRQVHTQDHVEQAQALPPLVSTPEQIHSVPNTDLLNRTEIGPNELQGTTVGDADLFRPREMLGSVGSASMAGGRNDNSLPWGSVSTSAGGGGGQGHQARRHMSNGTGISPVE